MAPRMSDEFDVFRIPHSRMMQLVNSCTKNLNVTDFANNDALFALLSNLQSVFNEFKSHEDIENEHIMTKLKSKLKAMAIYNSAVCNCHKDDEFTPLLNLVELGYLYINKTKSTSERISFGVKLRKALNQFTQRFVPHMREEEEVFQPLLMEYFTVEELADMKSIVIKLHLQKRKLFSQNNTTDLEPILASPSITSKQAIKISRSIGQPQGPQIGTHSWLSDASKEASSFQDLPNEIALKIFSHLTLSDKFVAARVCRKWNQLIYDSSNWKELRFADWNPNLAEQDQNQNDTSIYKDTESNYDIDEDFESQSENRNKEMKTLQFWIKNLLPKIGTSLHKLDISFCKSLNNNLTRRILQLSPNINTLNLSYTNIGDNSFKGVRLDKLEFLNCEGCDKITDNSFKYLLISSAKFQMTRSQICKKNNHTQSSNKSDQGLSCGNCTENHNNIEEIYTDNNENTNHCNNHHNSESQEVNSVTLKSINLSGCWSITDYGLSYIASKYDLSNLEYLNLSGCVNLTSFGMNLFTDLCNNLTGENLYYCDNIVDGPLRDTANACENLECGSKFCCRSLAF